jgi:microsomal epoxide hydrolase
MYKKKQAEEYLQRVMKASMAEPTDSAVAMAFAGFTTDNSPALSKIDKPTVIAVASKELMPTFQDMQKHIPGSKIETFDDAGHALFVDDAEKFNILLEEFITTLK